MKTCIKCLKEKDLNSFWKYTKSFDWLQSMCKVCKRSYDNEYTKSMTKDQKQNKYNKKNELAKRKYEFINKYLVSNWCIDCWYNKNPAALQFDHIWDKSFTISHKIRSLWLDSIMNEVGKCEVRCANCHLIKTSKDYWWYVGSSPAT